MSRPPEPDTPSHYTVPRSSRGSESPRSSWLPRTRSSSRIRAESSNAKMKELASLALSGLQTITSLTSEAVSDVGVPGLGIGLSVLERMFEKIETMSSTVDGIETLVERIGKLRATLEEFRGRKIPPYMRKRIVGLSHEWEKFCGDGKKVKSRNAVMRFLRSSKDAEQLKQLAEKFNASFDHFQFETILNTATAVHTMADNIQAQQDGTRFPLSRDADDRHGIIESFMPPYAQYAAYDANEARQGCLEGTRVGVLREIWSEIPGTIPITTKDGDDGSGSHCKIILIEGGAGMGKSTIAYSIAEECSKRDVLSASFCCSRSDPQCSDTQFIIPTIASQLARRYVPFKEKVVEAMKRNPDILAAGPARQMEELLLRPLKDLKDTLPTIVIVIDALDECSNHDSLTMLMKVLAKYIHHLHTFVFVFTSRPEGQITTQFDRSRKETLGPFTKVVALHEISQDQVDADLGLYLEDGFNKIKLQFRITEEWPCREDRKTLLGLAHGLFIYTRTALRFIGHDSDRNPKRRLASLLAPKLETDGSSPTLDDLDRLYSEIIMLSYPDISVDLFGRLQTILGAILLCQRPLPIPVLSNLLRIPADDIQATLSGLHSVLYIPAPGDDTKPIRLLHPTFREFLLRSSPPRPNAFYIHPAQQHSSLLLRCMDTTRALKRNVLDIDGPSTTFVTEVPDLSQRSAIHTPPHLQYACEYWSAHLRLTAESHGTVDLFEPTHAFVETRLLFWLEACAWLGKFDIAVTSLDHASEAFQALGGRYAELASLLRDYRRFALAYSDCIRVAPLEMYRSALAIAPRSSILAQTYRHELELSPHLGVQRGVSENWGPCLAAFTAHGGYAVNTTSFSPDYASFATGGDDGKLKIWDARTCALLLSIDAHPNAWLCSVGYSPNQAHIATGSTDKTLRIWDISTGHRISMLEGHAGRINHVQYSGDGSCLLAETEEGELKLWSISDSSCILTLQTGVNHTQQAAISSDGMLVAYGGEGALCLYHVHSKTIERLNLHGHVQTIAISSDGFYIAAGTGLRIDIWTLADREYHQGYNVSEGFLRLAFSVDGAQIGCGCGDGSIRLWEVWSRKPTGIHRSHPMWPSRILRGHTGWVGNITWSLDGSRIVSAGDDGTVRVWDATLSHVYRAKPDVHSEKSTSPPRFVVARDDMNTAITVFTLPSSFGPVEVPDDAPPLTWCPDVLSSWDMALYAPPDLNVLNSLHRSNIWQCWTGQGYSQFGDHTISFSEDGGLMACRGRTSQSVAEVYSLRTGHPTASLSIPGYRGVASSTAFSPNAAHLVTGHWEGSVSVWSIASGARTTSHDLHTDKVLAVALSPEPTRYVLSGSCDNTARLFDMESNKIVYTLEHGTIVVNVAFSADGVYIITQDGWNLVDVWDLATGTRVVELNMRLNVDLSRFNYSSDGTGTIRIEDNDATTHTILVRKDRRGWPVHLIDSSGWVYAKSPRGTRRVAWLPPEWRMLLSSENQQLCVYDALQEAVVVLDISQLSDLDLDV